MMAMTVSVFVPRRFRPSHGDARIKGFPSSIRCIPYASALGQSSPPFVFRSRVDTAISDSMAAIQFNDADVAAGALRLDQTLIGRLCGPLPSLSTLRSIVGRVWKCDFSLAFVEWDLLQFVLPNPATAQRIRAGSPWVFEKFLIQVRQWETPTAELASELIRVPLVAQLWGVPYNCCTERLGSLLGAALGPSEPATIHRSISSGGLYIRTKITLDLQLPLPDEVSAAHEDPSKGHFKAKVKFESLPQFCFLCGVVGHVNRFCPRREELSDQAPRYGKELVAREFGPRVNEGTLARRRKRFVWTLAGNHPGAPGAGLIRSRQPIRGTGQGPKLQPPSLQSGMASQLGQLCISADPYAQPDSSLGIAHQPAAEVVISPEPMAKKPRLGAVAQENAYLIEGVEETGPNRSQPHP
ncbi:unnamed protein product [Linum trigynum]|uniref:CCHC-type domain-containing protein n=1 Tax=Linum trigynum TaxID=586398 RepID=A0AAV2ENK4_9ROSI